MYSILHYTSPTASPEQKYVQQTSSHDPAVPLSWITEHHSPSRAGSELLSLTKVGLRMYVVRCCASTSGYVAERATICLLSASTEYSQLQGRIQHSLLIGVGEN